jgi:transposase
MLPLPKEPFDMSQWSHVRVNIDYHIAFDDNFYSVPYRLSEEPVEVRATPTTVEIFHKRTRVASHPRGRGRNQDITQNEHRPKSHQAHLEWTPARMVHWAGQIGPHTARLLERILSEKPHPEMGYLSCLGIIRLAERYSAIRMEGAAQRALESHACRFKSVESILKNSLDQQPFTQLPSLPPPPPHDNIRGGEYFE